MAEADIVRQSFLRQAKACGDLGSPFTARLCTLLAERLDEDTSVGKLILNWPGDPTGTGDAVALRLAGSLHALVLSGSDSSLVAAYPPNIVGDEILWQACRSAFERDAAFILQRLRSAPQTNEVRRSAALLPGFLTIARLFDKPLVLSEVGASAGLNLQWDRYSYGLGDFTWGPESSVSLTPEWQGPPPPRAEIHVAERSGCDLNPLDPASPEDRLRLMSYIWADQNDRLERTQHALEIAVENRLTVEKTDAIEWLEERLVTSRPRTVHVVYHTIAWQYLPEELKRRGEALISEAGSRATDDAPVARLQLEADGRPDGAAITLQVWPGQVWPDGEKYEIGRADFHGRWIKWKGWPGLL
ncbi:hypothetical protein ACO34A_16995 [Rhizobium sp. ACO-34A]|nr:DUF2332 family protein [Rhizobium sp. ACO-34A]ATN35502.1 hypothetical protein ACO34A_16995 [Rhizobium sp. ACO-34A]